MFFYFCYLFSGLLCVPIHEVLDQHRNVFPSVSKRRHVDRENIQPVEEVRAKHLRCDGRLQIAVAGSDYSSIGWYGAITSNPLKLALLEHTQQRDLCFRGQFADFIEKNRAGMRQLKTALSALKRASKCSLLMAKEF